MKTRIAQISDTHLSPSKPFFQKNFERVAEHLRDNRPDLVINTGDLALDGADSAEDLVLASDAHIALGIETHLLPGNHDVGDHPEVAGRQPANEERLARYREIVGQDFWSVDVPGWRLIGINSLILGTSLSREGIQRDLIRNAVTSLDGRALALFMHKPLADESYAEKLSINRFTTPRPRATLLECLAGVVPAVVLCGHVHQYRTSMMAGTHHIWAPGTSFLISEPWQPLYGQRVVGHLEHDFHADGSHDHRLVAVPDLAPLDLADIPDAYGDVRSWGPGKA